MAFIVKYLFTLYSIALLLGVGLIVLGRKRETIRDLESLGIALVMVSVIMLSIAFINL